MESIKQKINKLEKLYSDITKYSSEIDKFNSYEIDACMSISDELTEISSILQNINKILKSVEKITDFNSIEQLFVLWHFINLVVYKIDTILKELDNISRSDSKQLTYEITDSQMESICKLYNNITVLYNKYNTSTVKLDIDIMEILENVIQTHDKFSNISIIQNIHLFTDSVKKYPFSINLYAFIIQKILLKCIPMGESVCNSIIDTVESVKDFIMLESSKYKLNTKTTHKTNPHIKTFGLTPNRQSSNLSDLSKELFGKSTKTDSGLELIAKSQKICIVISHRIINKPLEFNLWNLIDWKHAKPFLQNINAGINKKMIDRFNTLTFVNTVKHQKWNFEIKYYGKIDSEYFTVIEKLGDDVYRLLNIYDRESDMYMISGGGIHKTKIHKAHIAEFIEYVKNRGIINDNTRVSIYHNIQERKILKNLFLPIKFNTQSINMQSQIVDSKYLRHELRTKLTDGFNEIIKKEYKSGTLIKNTKDIGKIIHHSNMSNIFNSIIIEQYDIYTFKNKENVSTFAFSETLKTFLSTLSLLNRNFIRGLHGKFTSYSLERTIFSEDNVTKKLYLDKMFTEIIVPVLDKLISNESNVYQSLIYKNSLLNLSVV
jgi:hypothetical protein